MKKTKKFSFFLLLLFLPFLLSCNTGQIKPTSKIQKEIETLATVTALASDCLQAQSGSKGVGGNPAFCQPLLDTANSIYKEQTKKIRLEICEKYFYADECYNEIYNSKLIKIKPKPLTDTENEIE